MGKRSARKKSSENSAGKDLVDGFFSRLKANKILAALVIFGVIIISLAKFTNSAQQLSDFYKFVSQTEKEKAIAELQKQKVDVNALSLLKSANEGDVEKVRLLLQTGISPASKDPQGWTPLHWAAMRGSVPVVQILLNYKADINAKDDAGQTPLMEAAAYCRNDVVAMLIKSGADLKDQSSRTALFWAAHSGCDETVAVLIRAGIEVNGRQALNWTPLMAAAAQGHVNTIKVLLKAGADKNLVNADGKTAEMLAQESGHKEAAASLGQASL